MDLWHLLWERVTPYVTKGAGEGDHTVGGVGGEVLADESVSRVITH